jgi:hypothetical protein
MVSLSQAGALEELPAAPQGRLGAALHTYRKQGASNDPAARQAVNREVGSIQMDMARRGQEMRKLRDDISGLEVELGLAEKPAGEGQK